MRRDRQRLLDMLEAIQDIERYAAGGYEAFQRDELLQTWVVHHIEIIGEAARTVSDALRKAHPEVAWQPLSVLRNALVHEYFAVDVQEVWRAVQQDLPGLKHTLQAILSTLDEAA